MAKKKSAKSSGLQDLRKHIIGIKGLIGNPELEYLSKQTAEMGQTMIDLHNTQGHYYGGEYAEKGYSTANLPVFFFGDFTVVEKTGNIRVNAPKMNLSNVLIKKEDIDWYTTNEGKRTAYVKGGYRTWLKYTRSGKNLNKVDHQFTGAMLRNLTHELVIHTKGSEIRWFVRSPHDKKAYYTHIRRNWLGFFDKEIDRLLDMAKQKYSLAIFERLTK